MEQQDNNIVKHSIFKQKVYVKRYDINQEHNQKYNGRGWIEKYETNILSKEDQVLIETKDIFNCDIPMPKLGIGEKFYIEDIHLLVTISELCRTSNNNMLYYIEPKLIEDELTELSKQEAEEKILKYNENKQIIGELNEVISNLRAGLKTGLEELEGYKRSYKELQNKWYVKLFNKSE